MHGKANHLGKVTDGGLPAIVLPVGVGDEAHRSIEGQGPGKSRQLLGVQGQELLAQQDEQQGDKQHQVEEQHGQGVALPAHLVVSVQSANPVQQTFAGG